MPLWSALVVSLWRQRVALAEETADRGSSVMPAFLEDLDQIPPGQDHDGMAVFADLLVGLGVDVGRRSSRQGPDSRAQPATDESGA